jgi:hypothetical protein
MWCLAANAGLCAQSALSALDGTTWLPADGTDAYDLWYPPQPLRSGNGDGSGDMRSGHGWLIREPAHQRRRNLRGCSAVMRLLRPVLRCPRWMAAMASCLTGSGRIAIGAAPPYLSGAMGMATALDADLAGLGRNSPSGRARPRRRNLCGLCSNAGFAPSPALSPLTAANKPGLTVSTTRLL